MAARSDGAGAGVGVTFLQCHDQPLVPVDVRPDQLLLVLCGRLLAVPKVLSGVPRKVFPLGGVAAGCERASTTLLR